MNTEKKSTLLEMVLWQRIKSERCLPLFPWGTANSASTGQGVEVLSIIFLSHGIPLSLLCLPWLVLQLCLWNWRRSGDSQEVTPGCTRDSHPARQQKQVGALAGREILLQILHQSSPARQPLPATPARLPPPRPVNPTSNPFLGLSVCITWFTEPLLELFTTAAQLGTRPQVRVKVLWRTMLRVSLGTNLLLKEKAECPSRNTPCHRILLLPHTVWHCLGCEHMPFC